MVSSMTIRRAAGLSLISFLAAGADGQTLLWEAYGTTPQDGFGRGIASGGDVTGDGAADLLVPVPWATVNGLTSAGLLRVFSGADGALVYTVTDNPPIQNGQFGSAAGLGDVDGDGLSEFIAKGVSVTVYSGADASPVLVLPVPSAGLLAGLGDVDGDGIPDFGFRVPASPGFYAVEVHSGATGGLISTAYPSFPSAFSTLAGVGDVDGDGLPDLAVGHTLDTFFSNGQVDVYTALTGLPILPIPGTVAGCGIRLAGAGDVNGDGLSDIVFGQGGSGLASYCNSNARVVGWPAGPDLMVIPQLSLCDRTGYAVDGGFDLDGDGFDDPIVGSPLHGIYVGSNTLLGAARIFSGQSGAVLLQVTGWPGATAINNSVSDLGDSVAYLGEVTGDEFPDFAAGASGVAGNNCGLVPGFPPYLACSGGVRVYSGAPAGVATFGSGCPGSSGAVPRIGATWEPSVGATWSVNLSRAVPGVPALLLLGFDNTQWWGVPLPFDLAVLGMPGCPLLVSPDLVVSPEFPLPGTSGNLLAAPLSGNPPSGGRAKVTFDIPGNPVLAGASVYLQWYVADPTPATPGGAVTRGLAVTLQP